MGWLSTLYETYNNNEHEVGMVKRNRFGHDYSLLPISHTTQTAHIEVNITENGDFHSAHVIERGKGITLIPATEEASNRAGLAANRRPYPLHDKISFVAGDFIDYAGKIRDEEPHQYYIKLIKKWVKSPYSTDKLKSIYKYITKNQLIHDLVNEKILYLDEEGHLIDKWNRKYEELFNGKPDIFTVSTGGQYSAFVRFNVHSAEKILDNVWQDKELYHSFIDFYNDSLGNKQLCMVTGKNLPASESHANKIRHAGDKAKLISANDKSGFTFRGKFNNANEVATISYDVSQKAHNALKWLIQRQGKIIDGRVFLLWSNGKTDIADITDDGFSLSNYLFPEKKHQERKIAFTNQELARELSKAIDGYKHDLETHDTVNILVIDSATTGRMAVIYYRNLSKDVYFKRLEDWHSTCTWLHRYRQDEDGNFVEFYGAPATRDIAFAAYGGRANNKLIKGLMERMLSCVIDGRDIPKDIIRSAYNRAINPAGMESWEWEKSLGITCALINKVEGIGVGLDEDIKERDYLFGRMLAVADVLERRALGREENRATNAIRYMNAFAKHPERTWKVIQENLQPYQERLGRNSIYLSSLIDEIASQIKYEDFNNKSLSGKFLLGFYSQRHKLYQKRNNREEDN